jgi:hypothetical protein
VQSFDDVDHRGWTPLSSNPPISADDGFGVRCVCERTEVERGRVELRARIIEGTHYGAENGIEGIIRDEIPGDKDRRIEKVSLFAQERDQAVGIQAAGPQHLRKVTPLRVSPDGLFSAVMSTG